NDEVSGGGNIDIVDVLGAYATDVEPVHQPNWRSLDDADSHSTPAFPGAVVYARIWAAATRSPILRQGGELARTAVNRSWFLPSFIGAAKTYRQPSQRRWTTGGVPDCPTIRVRGQQHVGHMCDADVCSIPLTFQTPFHSWQQ